MDKERLQHWLDGYIEAWRTYEPDRIRTLFTDDIQYRYHPHDKPVRGIDALVASWLEDRDDPETWRASYEPFAVDDDTAVATGTSTYLTPEGGIDRVYHNAYVMRFDPDDRCSSFTEWFMLEPKPGG